MTCEEIRDYCIRAPKPASITLTAAEFANVVRKWMYPAPSPAECEVMSVFGNEQTKAEIERRFNNYIRYRDLSDIEIAKEVYSHNLKPRLYGVEVIVECE